MTMTWKWELVIYLWIAGIAGGAYFVAFLVNWLTGRKAEQLPKIATLIGVPLVGVGSLLLIVDLGEQLRAWHLFTRFKIGSPMNMGSWILLLSDSCSPSQTAGVTSGLPSTPSVERRFFLSRSSAVVVHGSWLRIKWGVDKRISSPS